jgi:hypothetical protein
LIPLCSESEATGAISEISKSKRRATLIEDRLYGSKSYALE